MLTGCAQTAQTGQNYGLPLFKHLAQLRKELAQVFPGHICRNAVHLGIEVHEQIVLDRIRQERQAAVRRIDGIASVGKSRRDQLGEESTDAGKADPVVVDYQFRYHLRQKLYIHIKAKIR